MIRLVMALQLAFFIAYGTLSGIAWREWAASEIKNAEYQAQISMLLDLPIYALAEISVKG